MNAYHDEAADHGEHLDGVDPRRGDQRRHEEEDEGGDVDQQHHQAARRGLGHGVQELGRQLVDSGSDPALGEGGRQKWRELPAGLLGRKRGGRYLEEAGNGQCGHQHPEVARQNSICEHRVPCRVCRELCR